MFMWIPQPHVATLSLHSLFELRSLLLSGTVCLDMAAASLDQVADLALDNMINCGALGAGKKEQVKAAVLKKHRHQFEGARKAGAGRAGLKSGEQNKTSMARPDLKPVLPNAYRKCKYEGETRMKVFGTWGAVLHHSAEMVLCFRNCVLFPCVVLC